MGKKGIIGRIPKKGRTPRRGDAIEVEVGVAVDDASPSPPPTPEPSPLRRSPRRKPSTKAIIQTLRRSNARKDNKLQKTREKNVTLVKENA
jgi:hypothetical protein